MSIIKKIYDLLTPKELKRATILMIMIMFMAFFDVVGVASVMPFIGVLVNPQIIDTNPFLTWLYINLGFTSTQDFLYFLGITVFFLLFISISFKALTIYTQVRYILMREASIGKHLIEGYLKQPYVWFLNRNSADLGKNILSEVGEVVNGSMLALVMLFAHGTVSLALIILLLFVDAQIALISSAVLIGSYLLFFHLGKNITLRAGRNRLMANNKRFTAVSEAFGAAKEVKLGGLEKNFVDHFSKYAEIYAKSLATAQVVTQLPRFGLELVAFGGLIIMMLVLMGANSNLETVLPIIAVYAFAGYRLIPALQQVYSGFSMLRFSVSALDNLHNDMSTVKFNYYDKEPSKSEIKFDKAIELNDVYFSYPNTSKLSLEKLNIVIPANSMIGLVGSTGCGKTTAVDLILGLLDPQKGTLTVDNVVIDQNNRRQWQNQIGYVPQQIYLSDDSVSSNIAFGMAKNTIDHNAIKQAAKIANLDKFVLNELPEGYDTVIGERGVRLSGGQRQRIGIARALYLRPKVLILDEATSALDTLTEQAVIDAITHLRHEITIIIIAHRLSTVRQCDQIFHLDKGRIKSYGTYVSLSDADEKFKSMLDS
jgi:ABC-type multidrug transport system fused ATPase/permease subunit